MKRMTVLEYRSALLKVGGALMALIIIVVGYFAAQKFYYQTPNKMWHDALSNSLQNKTVTTTITQKTSDIDRSQTITYNAGAQNEARSNVVLRGEGSLVVTETLGTLTADYSRYTQIRANDKDYKNVLNVWAKTDVKAEADAAQRPLLSGVALRTASVPGVPLIDAPIAQQANLYALLNKAITADIAQAQSVVVAGRPALRFTATIKPEQYLTYTKTLDQILGYDTLTDVAPASYRDRPSATAVLTIDATSHRFIGLSVPQVEGYTESYGDYGKPLTLVIPKQTVTTEELQKRLQNN